MSIQIPPAVPDDVLDIMIRCADADSDTQRVLMELECYRRFNNGSDATRRCAAAISTDPPQDCDAPFCGCNPEWHKVIEMLQESGWGKLP